MADSILRPVPGTDLQLRVLSPDGKLVIAQGLNGISVTESEWFALLDEIERQAQEQHNERMTGRMVKH